MSTLNALPALIESALASFTEAAVAALGDDLVSLTLFGSAAEGRLRPSSDVNVLLVLRRAEPEALARLRSAARTARLQAGLEPMLVLESELGEAATAFADKFEDLKARRRVLAGTDPLASLAIPRDALRARLSQSLLNLSIRQRRLLLELPPTEDQAAGVLAALAGPLRACAHSLLALEGAPAPSPREALARVAAGHPGGAECLTRLSLARERGALPVDAAEATLRTLAVLTESMRHRTAGLP